MGSTQVADHWKPIAVVVALLIASMKSKPDYNRIVIWLMRIAAIAISLLVLSDYLAFRLPNKWPIPTVPKLVGDILFPVIYILLYIYFIKSVRSANMAER